LHGIKGGIVAELQGGKTFSPIAGMLRDAPYYARRW